MLVVKLRLNFEVLLLRIDPYMIVLSEHCSILEVLLLHTERQLTLGINLLRIPMDIIVLRLLVSINYLGAWHLLNSFWLRIRIFRLHCLLEDHHFRIVFLLHVLSILLYFRRWLANVEL